MDRIMDAQDKKQQRVAGTSSVSFAMDLPIHARLDDIRQALACHQVVVICGETGSGKTTQLPKVCLDMNRGRTGLIGHTQPRRIAARTVAARIAEELAEDLGRVVGYQVRHTARTSAATRIKLMTDGILLAELQHDRRLERYATLIIDEAHERSLNIDFLLGYLKQLLPRRPDLQLIITSATIDPERFSAHFHRAPIIEVSGRGYPVDVRYRPVGPVTETAADDDENFLAIHDAIREVSRHGRGDVLVFMEGEREIHELTRFLQRRNVPDTDILPLYSRLSGRHQDLIFRPHQRRHIVVATNVAETSLTIPGIHYVIDPGYARVSRYNRRSKVQQLLIEKISRAAAEQRKGRCGRTAAGICIRLYAEEDLSSRPPFTEPEILRTNLASVILQMKSLRLGDIHDFPFIDPPDMRYINDGLRLLNELGAIDQDEELTGVGRRLARLPLDPVLGRVLLAAADLGCLREILVIVSGLSIQDPRERPPEAREQADAAHARFRDDRSDFLTLLKLWDLSDGQARTPGSKKFRRLCSSSFLSHARMREWREVHDQLQELTAALGLHVNAEPAAYRRIHAALITGMLSHIAVRTGEREYTGARGIKLHVFPGSGQFQKLPRWILCAELVETSKLYGRCVAAIEAQWILRPAARLLQREYLDPFWDSKAEQVCAHERIRLFGLMLVERLKINYGRINPVAARRIFIQQALVERKLRTGAGFFTHNNGLVDELKMLEEKSRRHDIINEQALHDFYDRHVPAGICTGADFSRWLAETAADELLCLSGREAIMYHLAEDITPERYPDTLKVGDHPCPLIYRFDPGADDDGVTLEVPLPFLNQVSPGRLDCLVPGLLEEKITLLLKNLPKPIRRSLAPLPQTARECAERINSGRDGLFPELADHLERSRGVRIPEGTWNDGRLPDYLRMNVRVVDDTRRVIARGRDVRRLQRELAGRVQDCFSTFATGAFPRTGIFRWDFGDLPETISVDVRGAPLTVWPALVDSGRSVSVQLFDTREQAAAAMPGGLMRLFMLELGKQFAYLKKNLPRLKEMSLFYATVGTREELLQDLLEWIAMQVFLPDGAAVHRREDFVRRREEGVRILVAEANRLCALAHAILGRYHTLRRRLEEGLPHNREETVRDIREHLEHLVHNRFLVLTDAMLLQHYPRYLDAVARRIERLSYAPEKDARQFSLIKPFQDAAMRLPEKGAATEAGHRQITEYRWLLEEFRVSLFAQELGTAVKVSARRLRDQLDRISPENGRMRAR